MLVGAKVKRIPLERYVRGVIGEEMSSDWPAAALEAQAVASRTYALTAHAGGSQFDVYSDSRSQVYRGAAAESPATDAAVAATAGQILLYEGRPAISYYFASSGGMTESVQDAFPGTDRRALAGRRRSIPMKKSPRAGSSRSPSPPPHGACEASSRAPSGASRCCSRGASPRVILARVLGSAAAQRVSGPELAARLGLPSTWDYFDLLRGGRLVQEPDKQRPRKDLEPDPGGARKDGARLSGQLRRRGAGLLRCLAEHRRGRRHPRGLSRPIHRGP